MGKNWYVLSVALALALLSRPAPATGPHGREPLHAAPVGAIVDAPDGRSDMELLRFDGGLVAALGELAPEETLLVAGWPVSPGNRAEVVLRRFDVYAPDARIVVIDGGREVEVPRSRTVFLMGTRIDGSGRFAVGLDPDTGTLEGTIPDGEALFTLLPEEDGSGRHRLAVKEAFDPEGTPERTWRCGQEDLPLEEHGPTAPLLPEGALEELRVGVLAPATKVAVIAVDTDNELMNLKFGNNAANATTYIASLFAEMNVIYERDVDLRLLQGYTILRPSTTADPYSAVGSDCDPGPGVELCASGAQLTEFRNYWNAQYVPVKRALAMMLSGKQTSNNAASGIASLNVLCGTSGYSFNQVFKFAQQTASSDTFVVAHEIGHNMASPHTHCYANPKPDTCFSGESGTNCFSGTPSCPSQAVYNGVTARGTLMSYCHLLGGCSAANVYHPDSLTRYVNGAVSAATSCIFAIGAAVPNLTNVSPAIGPLAGGTSLTLTGTNFASGATVAFVELPSNDVFGTPSAKAGTSVVFVNATQLTVTTPSASAAGAVNVVVMNPDFQTATLASGYTYSVAAPPPTVTAVSPNSGSTAGGTSVTITGTGFVATPSVTFGGANATSEVLVNSTTLTATTPARAAGLVNVVVTNPDAQSGTLTNGFAYLPPPSTTRYFAITPCRLFDTRNATGPDAAAPALVAGATRTFDVSGRCGVPETAVSLAVNVTVTGPGAAGELRIFPGNGISPNPPASAIFYAPGKTRANNAVLRLATDGTATYKVQNVSAASTHFILDVSGYFLP